MHLKTSSAKWRTFCLSLNMSRTPYRHWGAVQIGNPSCPPFPTNKLCALLKPYCTISYTKARTHIWSRALTSSTPTLLRYRGLLYRSVLPSGRLGWHCFQCHLIGTMWISGTGSGYNVHRQFRPGIPLWSQNWPWCRITRYFWRPLWMDYVAVGFVSSWQAAGQPYGAYCAGGRTHRVRRLSLAQILSSPLPPPSAASPKSP